MSSEAVGWVFRHSPYRGIGFTIHLALADSANDQNHYELWMKAETIASKARVSRARAHEVLRQMVLDGYLELVDADAPRGRYAPVRYRLLIQDSAEVVFDSRHRPESARGVPSRHTSEPSGVPSRVAEVCREGQSGVPSGHTSIHIGTQVKQPKEKQPKELLATTSSIARKSNPIWDALVEVFGDAVTPSERSMRGKAVKDLREAGAGCPDEELAYEIVHRASAWPDHFPTATLTLTALLKFWTTLGRVPLRGGSSAARMTGLKSWARRIESEERDDKTRAPEDPAVRPRGLPAGGG